MAGTALGKAGDGSTIGEGGLAIFVDGAPQGVRPNLKYQGTPGVRHVAVDQPAPAPARVVVTTEVDAEVKLGPTVTGIDLTSAGATQLLAALVAQLAHVTKLVLIAEDIDTVGVQPTVRCQTDAGLPGNLAAAQALAFTANGQIRELTLVTPRPGLDPGPSSFDQVELDTTVQATATTYLVTAQVWGVILTP